MKNQELQEQEHPQERLRRLRTEAFTKLIELWPLLSPELQRRRLGWLVGQCDVEAAAMLIRYCEAKSSVSYPGATVFNGSIMKR